MNINQKDKWKAVSLSIACIERAKIENHNLFIQIDGSSCSSSAFSDKDYFDVMTIQFKAFKIRRMVKLELPDQDVRWQKCTFTETQMIDILNRATVMYSCFVKKNTIYWCIRDDIRGGGFYGIYISFKDIIVKGSTESVRSIDDNILYRKKDIVDDLLWYKPPEVQKKALEKLTKISQENIKNW